MILQGTPATLSVSYYVDGAIADPGAVTVTITGESGATIATDASAGGSGAAARTHALTSANTASLDNLTAVWTSTTLGDITTHIEVVGDLLFSEAEARAHGRGELSDTDDYPAATLLDDRIRITEIIQNIIGYPLGRRYRREVLSGNGKDEILIPGIYIVDPVRSVEYRTSGTTTWTAFTADELADVLVEPWGRLTRETLGIFPGGRRNLRIGYDWGVNNYPAELKEAALNLIVDQAVASDISPRAMSYSDGLGTMRFVTPGLTRGAYTSLPHVNETLQRLAEKVPGVG